MMPKIRTTLGGGQIFFCPGCNSTHAVNLSSRARWTYNNNPDAPTFAPSILVTYDGADTGHDDAPPERCHSFVRDGQIQFLGDCTHALAGKTVVIPDWPYAPGTYGGLDESEESGICPLAGRAG